MTTPGSGYRSDFLSIRVPLPTLNTQHRADAVRMNGSTRFVVPYTNFSLVLSRERRLARYTAVNIDGQALVPVTRPSDVWRYDTRLAREAQIGKAFYKNNVFDQGHLVRRLDPVWGSRALQAHKDTFFLTNCAPQHEKFNRNEWGDIEDYVLKNTDTHNLRVTVFTGPVFGAADPIVKDVQVPLEFWKLVVMVKRAGTPSATAYLHTQRNLLGLRDFEFGAFRSYQVKVSAIIDATQLAFHSLSAFDPLARQRDSGAGVELKRLTDILL